MDDTYQVTCPYCGELVEVYVEPDVRGSFVQDCEVCCNPGACVSGEQTGSAQSTLPRPTGPSSEPWPTC